jgi:hypothetical protein
VRPRPGQESSPFFQQSVVLEVCSLGLQLFIHRHAMKTRERNQPHQITTSLTISVHAARRICTILGTEQRQTKCLVPVLDVIYSLAQALQMSLILSKHIVFDAALSLVPLSMRTDLSAFTPGIEVSLDDVRQCVDLFNMREKKYFASRTFALVFTLLSKSFSNILNRNIIKALESERHIIRNPSSSESLPAWYTAPISQTHRLASSNNVRANSLCSSSVYQIFYLSERIISDDHKFCDYAVQR